ncbi:serine O-acetyltransferase EpsC [Streptomyces sp. NPDC054975]
MRRCDRALRAAAGRMREDVATVLAKDPAAGSRREVLLYPHIQALWTYRVAHWLWSRGHRLTARALSLGARAVTGIEIHPAAVIGRRFFIDHGTAVVIGATVRIGDDVMLYHQVTLGSAGWWKDLRRSAGARRHPVVEDGVIIGTGASVLGSVTVGAGARIGAHSVVLTDLAPGTRVTAPPSEIHRPAAELHRTTAEITRPVAEVPRPTADIPRPTAEVHRPAAVSSPLAVRPSGPESAPESSATHTPTRVRPVRIRPVRGRAALPSALRAVRRNVPPTAAS